MSVCPVSGWGKSSSNPDLRVINAAGGGASLRLALQPKAMPQPAAAAIKEVKELLLAHQQFSREDLVWAKDDQRIARYITSEDGSTSKAAKRLIATVEWRKEVKPASVRCLECERDHRAHDLRCIGLDLHGRPVIYNCFACSDARGPQGLLAHFTKTLEESVRRMRNNVQTLVWVADFEGFGLRDAIDPRFSVWLLNLFQKHYPDCVEAVVCVDAPRLFSALWAAVKPFMSERTKRRVIFVRAETARTELANALFGTGSAASEWLQAHMAASREKAKVRESWKEPHPLPPAEAGRRRVW